MPHLGYIGFVIGALLAFALGCTGQSASASVSHTRFDAQTPRHIEFPPALIVGCVAELGCSRVEFSDDEVEPIVVSRTALAQR